MPRKPPPLKLRARFSDALRDIMRKARADGATVLELADKHGVTYDQMRELLKPDPPRRPVSDNIVARSQKLLRDSNAAGTPYSTRQLARHFNVSHATLARRLRSAVEKAAVRVELPQSAVDVSQLSRLEVARLIRAHILEGGSMNSARRRFRVSYATVREAINGPD